MALPPGFDLFDTKLVPQLAELLFNSYTYGQSPETMTVVYFRIMNIIDDNFLKRQDFRAMHQKSKYPHE
jgi:hypothetical protein